MSDLNPLFKGEEEAGEQLSFPSPTPEPWLPKPGPKVDMNIFADATNPVELIGMAMGFAQMCWENVDAAGKFDSQRAQVGLEHAINRLAQLSDQSALEDQA